MLEKFSNARLTNDQLRMTVGGGPESWECTCGYGTVSFNGWGYAGDLRQDIIDAGCANSPTYCSFTAIK